MRVLRGGREDPEADREVTAEIVERVREAGEPALRVWRPPKQVAFGRRDARAAGYRRAREAAIERGYPPIERRVGGRAAAHTGWTLAVALAEPAPDFREGLAERYERVSGAIQRALWRLGVPAERGEPEGAFCPGSHSLQSGGKLAGLAQRVEGDVALVGAVVVLDAADELAAVLGPVYDALGLPFDPDSVGSVAGAGGDPDPETAGRTVENLVVGEADARVERVDREG